MVEIDSSCILVEPLKNRTDAELTRAYESLMARLHQAGVKPKKHVLDNEVSAAMKQLITTKYNMTYELVPPGCHRRNAAEVAIRNFKSHFLSILAGVSPNFPIKLWDKLLPQAEITINLLRQSNATPTISAYAHLNGPFDYNKMPLAPMGCDVQVHEKTDKRGTWAFHSVDGWYLSTSPEHYRTHRCHIKSTNSERLSDTVHFQHKDITRPSVTPADKLMQAIADCKRAILGYTTPAGAGPLHHLRAILRVAEAKITSASETTGVPRVEDTSTHLKQPTHDLSKMTAPPPRVPPPQLPITYSTTPTIQPSPTKRVVARTSSKRRKRSSAPVDASAPAMNTRSRTAPQAPPPATPAKPARQSKLRQPTASSSAKRTSTRQSARLAKLEKKIYKALAVMDKATGKLLNYRQLLRHPEYSADWQLSSANEFGRLANGVGGRVKGTNTIKFIKKSAIPHDRRRDVTYGQFVCTIRPEKSEPNRTRFVAGGNKVNYPGEVATPTADMLVAKILFNSVVSTKDAKFMTMDISNFYLCSPMKHTSA
jgi:hypothetical protein